MDSRTAAPAVTAARQQGIGPAWLASLSLLLLLLVPATAIADTVTGPDAGDRDAVAQGAAARLISSDNAFAARLLETALATAPQGVKTMIEVSVPLPKPTESSRDVAAIAADGNARTLKPTVIFGSSGRSVGLSPISRRWQRATAELAAQTASTQDDSPNHPAYDAILTKARPLRRGLQIPKVNALVNRLLTYREDSALHETGEYWASPTETLSHLAGDCEDFAILKYAILRDLGINDNDMRIVVLRDTAVRQFHAVLTVRHKGQWLVLDNRFSRVRFERDLPHYKPLYSVNAAGEWAHTREPGHPVQLAARLKAATR